MEEEKESVGPFWLGRSRALLNPDPFCHEVERSMQGAASVLASNAASALRPWLSKFFNKCFMCVKLRFY